jgi:hypothetical protein
MRPATTQSFMLSGAPPGVSIHHPLETADPATAAGKRFIAWVDSALASPGKLPYGFMPFETVLAYRITGNQKYGEFACQLLDAEIVSAQSQVVLGKQPLPVMRYNYLGAPDSLRGFVFGTVWLDMATPAQKESWAAFARQAAFNIWHPTQASWFGKPMPWNGWGTQDSGSNYYYAHLYSTILVALGCGPSLMDFCRSTLWPSIIKEFSTYAGGGSREGTSYGEGHRDLFEAYLVWRLSAGDDFAALTSHCADSLDYWLHATVPGGKYLAEIGDQSRDPKASNYDYFRMIELLALKLMPNAPHARRARWWLLNQNTRCKSTFNCRDDMLADALPGAVPAATSYTAKAAGHHFARTDWTLQAAYVYAVCGIVDEGHQHQEQGSFGIWAHGTWASVNQIWMAHSGTHHETIYQNVVRFNDAKGNVIPQVNAFAHPGVAVCNCPAIVTDRGGTWTVNMDLSSAYKPGAGVTSWKRTLTFSRDTRQLIVNDSLSASAGVVATFQLQFPEMPTINGNSITVGAASAVVSTPAKPQITVVPMNSINPKEFAKGGWRVDISGGSGAAFSVTLQL